MKFIGKFKGLPINCDLELKKVFKDIDENTLSSILYSEWNHKIKAQFHKIQAIAPKMLKRFEDAANKKFDDKILVNMSIQCGLSPTILSRLIINEKYPNLPKNKILEMIKNPYTIPDDCLAANARACSFCDNQDGPIVDVIRRCVGEEYEQKLKNMASEAGMVFYDEGDLRRVGFDKTPDLKLALPCLYKGKVVNWIESKALFGDLRTHRRYLREQLTSYCNRFGPGIVIYWFGYLEDIKYLSENSNGLIIIKTFPDKTELEFLKIDI